MADYTYATSSGKTYDDFMKEADARAAKQAAAYAQKAQAANQSYKTAMNAVYDAAIRAQEQTAAADTQRTWAAYNAQFDANAASQLARERHLKQQMADYGLGQSGYNATNQTALAVARSHADAATRTARGQAVDAIAEELRKYKADTENRRATALAESDRTTADGIRDIEQALLSARHGEVMDLLGRDDTLAQFAWERETDAKDRAYQAARDAVADAQWTQEFEHQAARDAVADAQWTQEFEHRTARDAAADAQREREFAWQQETDEKDRAYQTARDAVTDAQWAQEFGLSQQELTHKISKDALYSEREVKEYVDAHNNAIYELMLRAYNSGNSALAAEYAKDLWKLGASGAVVPMTFDTAGAAAFADKQAAQQADADAKGESADTEEVGTYDELGFARAYDRHIREARSTVMQITETSDSRVKQQLLDRALNLIYLIRQRSQDGGEGDYMSSKTFQNLLRYVGLTEAQYNEYVKRVNGAAADDAPTFRIPQTTVTHKPIRLDK